MGAMAIIPPRRRRQVRQRLLGDVVQLPFSSSSSTTATAASTSSRTARSTRSISHSCDGPEPSPSIGFPAPASRSASSSSTLSTGVFSSTAETIWISPHKLLASREKKKKTIKKNYNSFYFNDKIFLKSLYTTIFNTVKYFKNYGIQYRINAVKNL